jgi:pimeloyl-ACP methyl ester carboxylesterase
VLPVSSLGHDPGVSISTDLGEERDIRLPQGVVRYRERGEGRPVVFIHGFVTNGDLWRKVVPPLAEKYRCVTPDWPLGSHSVPMDPDADLSPLGIAELIAAFLEELDLEDAVVVGNDTGGALAQMLVTTRPERVGALVLTPCDSFRNFPAWWSQPLRPLARSATLMRAGTRLLRSRRFQRLPLVYGWVVKRPFPPEISESFVGPGNRDEGIRRDFAKAFGATRPAQTLDAAEKLRSFGKPALVVWQTERGLIYPVRHGRRLAELLDARLELVDDSYIYVPEDRPERLAELIDGFLETRLEAPR